MKRVLAVSIRRLKQTASQAEFGDEGKIGEECFDAWHGCHDLEMSLAKIRAER